MRQVLPEFISPTTAAKLLDYKSRTSIHTLIAREQLPTIRIGKAVRIEKRAFLEWLKQKQAL